ncbi:hypothetical protein BC835DRAFT_656481 [Cytidiella melzeri]|nr:hypothetical protein BC835DRAFT_656481 [Cytidiella melzeri]
MQDSLRLAVAGNTETERPSILFYLNDDVLQLIILSLRQLAQQQISKTSAGDAQIKASLLPMSLTCRKFRAYCAPCLFHLFRLVSHGDKNPWMKASNKLELWNNDFGPFVRKVVIDLKVRTYGHNDPHSPFVDELPDNLAGVLQKMSGVERITFSIDDSRVHHFETAFINHNLAFPGVRRLTVAPPNNIIVKLCPNTEALQVVRIARSFRLDGDLERMIAAVSELPRLQCIHIQGVYEDELMEGEWYKLRLMYGTQNRNKQLLY